MTVVLDTFMRALPHTLRGTRAPVGTAVRVRIDGPAGGTWTARVTKDRWSLVENAPTRPDVTVGLDAETAWQLCTRRIQPDTALSRARIDGDHDLAETTCQIVSIIH